MQIDVGYFYFVKDDFFDIINDPELMKNKENGIKRPCYFCFEKMKFEKSFIFFFYPNFFFCTHFNKNFQNQSILFIDYLRLMCK